MSDEKIDVLAVMGGVLDAASDGLPVGAGCSELERVRDAMSELICAATVIDFCATEGVAIHTRNWARLTAALGRVRSS